ncbi:MAG: hypothetical protein K8R36_10950, partial [Planctomycetales bacterium]|nr:hypothetical protein [Planctomycetales bacterium]
TSLLAQELDVKKAQPADMGVINDVDVTVTNVTEEKLKNPPARKINFDRLKGPLKMQLPKPDPKILEQKFVASFFLEAPANGSNFTNAISGDDEIAPLQAIGDRSLVAPGSAVAFDNRFLTTQESIQRMIQMLPAGDTIAKEEREFLANPQTLNGMLYVAAHNEDRRKLGWTITLFGTTPDEAEKRAIAVMTLFDQGACRSVRLAIFKNREPLCAQLRDQRKAAESAEGKIDVVQKELKSYVDFTPDMLPNLRVQQLQLDVDMAGVKARIAACDRLLAGTALKPERRSQVEDLKVAAEIEFSGFEARLTKSNEIITRVKTKIDLVSHLTTAEAEQKKARSKAVSLERQIQYIDGAISAYSPLPLVDNKVVVQPLEWTQ